MADGSAAATARQHQLYEEEEMTTYSPEDLNNFEFKIVRANTGVFGKPEVFNKLIHDEARAGWELMEKFDDRRVRFKRPVSARASDGQLPADVNPYRTHYGMPPLRFALLIIVVVLVGVCLLYAMVFGLFGAIFNSSLLH